MNKVVRGYLARCQFKRMLARHFHRSVVVPAVITIQCMSRSTRARILLKRYKHEKVRVLLTTSTTSTTSTTTTTTVTVTAITITTRTAHDNNNE